MKPDPSTREGPGSSRSPSTLLSYLVPLLVAGACFAFTWPLQVDRLAEDEVRELFRAFALRAGESSIWGSWRSGVHPPLVPTISAFFLGFLPAVVALRVPSIIAGFGTVLLVVALGRRATGRPEVGLLAGLLVAASPVWWAYSSAISLDLPLAGFAALAAFAVIRPHPSLVLAVLAVAGASVTKRHGLAIVAIAILLASLASRRSSGWVRGTALLVAIALAAASAWVYYSKGQELFGSTTRIEELLSTSPAFIAFAVGCVVVLAVVYLRTEPPGRSVLLPLTLFSVPLLVTPFVGAFPAPRYFLPVVPTAATLVAATIWLSGRNGGAAHTALRWVISFVVVAGWFGFQLRDLQKSYWPRHRGHLDACVWLAENAGPDARIFAPEGPFLRAAALQAGITTPRIVTVGRRTCASLEGHLARAEGEAWVVLPLYRQLGWADDLATHAAAMGLEPRALVRRDVRGGPHAVSWEDAEVVSLGPPDGTALHAILFGERKPNEPLLKSSAETVALTDFGGPEWFCENVEIRDGPHGGTELQFTGQGPARVYIGALPYQPLLSTVDWHHHRWLEMRIRAADESLRQLVLLIGMRNETVGLELFRMREISAVDGWRRLALDLGTWPIEETSRIQWLMLATDRPHAPPPRIELAGFWLLPDKAIPPAPVCEVDGRDGAAEGPVGSPARGARGTPGRTRRR